MTINRMEYIAYWLMHYSTWPPYPLGRKPTNRRIAVAWLLYHHRYRNGGFITQ
jgi:hypothetical protein